MLNNGVKLFLFTLIAYAFILTSCGHKHDHDHSHDGDKKTEQTIDKSSKEYASAYICPMHCKGSGSEAPGKCPVCEMDYVKNENTSGKDDISEDNEEDDHSEESHDHDDHEGHTH